METKRFVDALDGINEIYADDTGCKEEPHKRGNLSSRQAKKWSRPNTEGVELTPEFVITNKDVISARQKKDAFMQNRSLSILILLLIVSCCSTANAEWVYVGSTDTAKIYYNNEGIERADGFVRVWNKIVFKVPEGPTRTKEIRTQTDFDTSRARSRNYYTIALGASGNILFEGYEEEGWKQLAPGASFYALWKACHDL